MEKDEKEREGLKKQATCINHATESMHHDLAQFFGKSSLSVPYMPTVRFSHFLKITFEDIKTFAQVKVIHKFSS